MPNIFKCEEMRKKEQIDKYRNSIIWGDSLDVMRRLPTGSIDLIITSPPYNLKNSSGNGMKDGRGGKWKNASLINGYQEHTDDMPYGEYCKWQRTCLRQMFRLIPDNGAIFYNHKWRVQRGLLQDRAEIVKGFPVRQIIIWKRKGGINFNTGYFLPTYEVIYIIAKPDFKLAQGANKYGDVWEITQEMNNPHPAPFPTELIDRIVSSTKATLILDPFAGSGTTGVAATNNNRDYILIDNSEKIQVTLFNKSIRQSESNILFFIKELQTKIEKLTKENPVCHVEKYREIVSEYHKMLKSRKSKERIYLLDKFEFSRFYVPPLLKQRINFNYNDVDYCPQYNVRSAINAMPFHFYDGWKHIFDCNNFVYIIGGPGYGKSLFLTKLINDYEQLNFLSDEEHLVIYGDLKAYKLDDDYSMSMVEYLQNCIVRESLIDRKYISKEMIEYFIDSGRCLLLFDALDEVEKIKELICMNELLHILKIKILITKYVLLLEVEDSFQKMII